MNTDILKDYPEILTTVEIAEFLQCSPASAVKIMKREGFPLLNPFARRYLKVDKYQFINWLRGEMTK